MAAPAARRLTEAHRITQARLGAQTVLRLRAVWPLLDPADLDGSFRDWLTAALPVIQAQRTTSSTIAASYLRTFKKIEAGGTAVPPTLADKLKVDAATTSLLVTGPLSVKRAMARGVDLKRAMDTAQAASSAAGMRYALDGGRETILETVRSDRDASGFIRVASGNACAYCEESAGKWIPDDDVFPCHDGCSCSAEPVYR